MPRTPVATPKAAPKETLSITVPAQLADRARDAVYWSPGETLSSFGAAALEAAVQRAEARRGEPFPPRPTCLKVGRPMKAAAGGRR